MKSHFRRGVRRPTSPFSKLEMLSVDLQIGNVDLLAYKPPVVTLEMTDKFSTSKALLRLKTGQKVKLMQIQTGLFAYEPILKALQSLAEFPLADELLYWTSSKMLSPSPQSPIKIIEKLEADPYCDLKSLLGTPNSVKLDESQALSLLTGLKQQVSLIQGPPGTQHPISFPNARGKG